jgi:hypothetical protein
MGRWRRWSRWRRWRAGPTRCKVRPRAGARRGPLQWRALPGCWLLAAGVSLAGALTAAVVVPRPAAVGACWLAKELLDDPQPYQQLCSIGLMPAALGLRVSAQRTRGRCRLQLGLRVQRVADGPGPPASPPPPRGWVPSKPHERCLVQMVHAFESTGVDALLGVFPCPTKLSVWASLAVAQAAVPGQNFLANMCGIASGIFYALVVAPGALARQLRRPSAAARCGSWLPPAAAPQAASAALPPRHPAAPRAPAHQLHPSSPALCLPARSPGPAGRPAVPAARRARPAHGHTLHVGAQCAPAPAAGESGVPAEHVVPGDCCSRAVGLRQARPRQAR